MDSPNGINEEEIDEIRCGPPGTVDNVLQLTRGVSEEQGRRTRQQTNCSNAYNNNIK